MSEIASKRLETLYQVSQAIGSTLNLDEVLNAVLDQVVSVTGAERGFLMLGEGFDDLSFQVARAMDHRTIESPEFQISMGVVERVAKEGNPVLTDDAQSETWLSDRASVHSLNLRSVMCVPLKAKGKSIGLVYVDNSMQTGIFTANDLELLQAVANTAAVAIENVKLHQLEVQRARIDRELEVARQIQSSLIPLKAPEIPGYSIRGCWRSAREVAGDFYDFILRPNGELGVVIGDVTDKGVPAAFFMALARTSIRASLMTDAPAEICITNANRLIYDDSSSGMFVTLYYIGLKSGEQTVTAVSAGHNPPIRVNAATEELETLPGGSLPLGIEVGQEYKQESLKVAEGDLILLYTDGVIDAINEHSEFYGLSRLSDVLERCITKNADKVLEEIEGSVNTFMGDTPQFDDITMVAVKCGSEIQT